MSPVRATCRRAFLLAASLLGFPCQWFISRGKPWQSDSPLLSYHPSGSIISRFRSSKWSNFPNLFLVTSPHNFVCVCSPTCCLRFSAMTPVLSWARTDSPACWDGSHISSCRLEILMTPQRKECTYMNSYIHSYIHTPCDWRFILQGDQVCCVSHLCSPHHIGSESVHWNHYRYVCLFLSWIFI